MANKTNKFEASKVFFTSDCHFGHANIIKYCNRPFKDVREMNEVLIENWNNVVGWTDTVFITGDFCFGQQDDWEKVLSQLAGEKYLVLGNHDKINNIPYDMFKGVKEQMFVTIINDDEIPSQQIFMSHYPMLTWNGSHRGSWQAYGHIHTEKGQTTPFDDKLVASQYDVGVDNNDYTPVSFQQLKEIITKRGLHLK